VVASQPCAIEEPKTETAVRGPREGFTEMLRVNTSQVHHKIRSADLKVVRFVLGTESRTHVDLLNIGGLAAPEIVDEVTKRLEMIKVPFVLETGIVEEWLEDYPYSSLPQMMYTERPDTAVAQLLQGRVAIIVDRSPVAMIAPITFGSLIQSSEDTQFPAVFELLMLELVFEVLREAGIRLPATMGQAVGILGALVIGQAVVQAGIVSAPVGIVVSLTGIASSAIPRYNVAIAIRLLRFGVLFMSGMSGLLWASDFQSRIWRRSWSSSTPWWVEIVLLPTTPIAVLIGLAGFTAVLGARGGLATYRRMAELVTPPLLAVLIFLPLLTASEMRPEFLYPPLKILEAT